MIRKPRLLRRTSPARSPAKMPESLPARMRAFLGPLGAAPAALLLAALLAGGCGAFVNERVPESFPSGARPAPVPRVDPAAASADQAELPPPPPAEPAVEPPPAGKAGEAATRPGTEAAPP